MFHNEAFPDSDSSNGNGSCMASPDAATDEDGGRVRNGNGQDLSPQRSHSFINVVINAIRNATSLKKEAPPPQNKMMDSLEQVAPERKLVPKQIERIQEEGVFGSNMDGKLRFIRIL